MSFHLKLSTLFCPSLAGEKPKWVPIPPSELQAAHDAHAQAHSNTSSRAHSQHRKNSNQNNNSQHKSRSRQHSQARPYHGSNISGGSPNNLNGSGLGVGLGVGSYRSTASTEASAVQSRAESSTQSRNTSVHSSPRFPTRGRRLPEDSAFVVNKIVETSANETGKKNSVSTNTDTQNEVSTVEVSLSAPVPQTIFQSMPLEGMHPLMQQNIYGNESTGYTGVQSGPHSQSSTPYPSHSPVYFSPPSASQSYGYGPFTHPGPYNIGPAPVPSPKHGSQQQIAQGYQGYPPPFLPQQLHIPPGQPHYHYMYPQFPYTYYPPQHASTGLVSEQRQRPYLQSQGQNEERINKDGAVAQAEPLAETTIYTSPVLPPTSSSARPRPPPPQESDVLSGYREIAAVPVSPLFNASNSRQSVGKKDSMENAESGNTHLTFGSIGKPGGLKSPSPGPAMSPIDGILKSERNERNIEPVTAFVVGLEDESGPVKIRSRRSTAKFKTGDEEESEADKLVEGIKVIDLSDNELKWEFGTSAHIDDKDTEETQGKSQDLNVQQKVQPLKPQPHQTLPYPHPIPPPQISGYNIGPQVHVHMPVLPLPSGSPQGPVQPLPQHIPSLAPLPLSTGFVSPLALSSPVPNQGRGMSPTVGGDEWEVRDFGFGFGPTSGTGYMPERLREERHEREFAQAREQREGGYREPRDYGNGRNRRTSNTAGYSGNSFEGGRGSYNGRRGRGMGNYNRGRNGYPRASGGYSQRHQPPLNISTTSTFQHPMQSGGYQQLQDMSNGYYVPPLSGTTQFIPSPYGQYNPGFPPVPQPQQQQQVGSQTMHPVPAPITTLTFPLDTTQYYLLGQIEYYFSPQNLASDLFLRRQVGYILENVHLTY